jgi:hypothetical protein
MVIIVRLECSVMNIILPDSEKSNFDYFEVITVHPTIKIAMVKIPSTLKEIFETELAEDAENVLVWYLTERQDEVDDEGENETSRYELRGSVIVPLKASPEDDIQLVIEELNKRLDDNCRKDGYVYFPKALRDGRHADRYLLEPINEEYFTTRTERGMFEEVAWSPFGSIEEATKQEAQNLERNPLMRNWI